MDKIIDFLNKKYDKKFFKSSFVENKNKLMGPLFKEDQLELKQDNELSFFYNEIVYQGILNKRKIEKAYFEARNIMNDYYETLDYKEKVRLVSYEIHKAAENIDHVEINGEKIFIPFFDERMNEIYYDEMNLFDIKRYNRYLTDYKDIIKKDLYGRAFYIEPFCSAKVVFENDNEFTLHSKFNNALYFIKDGLLVDHLSLIRTLTNEEMNVVSTNYFFNDPEAFVYILKKYELIMPKHINKIDKILKKELK